MNNVYRLFLLPLLFLPDFSALASPQQVQLPVPSVIRNMNKQNPELLRLQKLLDEGQIIPFYQVANKMRKEAKLYRKENVTPQELKDGLFLCYLIAKAPFIDLNDYANVEWIANYGHVDHTTKEFMSNSIPFLALIDKNSKLPGKEEALHLYLSATALVIKQFHTQVDYAFEATEICAYMLIDHARGFSDGKDTELFNTTSARGLRSIYAKSAIQSQERGFIRELMTCFPTKAQEVKKYLRLAGYGDKEIPALLDRTVGRTPEAAYLYKGLPKHRD